MVVYLFYIFDRHTECVYLKSWLPTTNPSRSSIPPTDPPASATGTSTPAAASAPATANPPPPPPSSTASARDSAGSALAPSTATASSAPHQPQPPPSSSTAAAAATPATLPISLSAASDDAKLVFGTVFSLRNMARKLGGDDDAFISYRTAQYKLHFYETPANLRFVLITDTASASMRNVLHQIYINLWVEYVVKNPLAPVEHKGGQGVKNELFELGLDQFIRGLA